MKLYTEEQVKTMLHLAELKHMDDQSIRVYTDEDLFETVTPIELPSDEEIKGCLDWEDDDTYYYRNGYVDGAKWVIEQIKEQVIP